MTAQGSRRTVIAIVTLALAAWWLWPRTSSTAAASATRAPLAARVGAARADAPLSVPTGGASPPNGNAIASAMAGDGDAHEVACRSANRQRLRRIRDSLDPARSAQEAFAHALLASALSIGSTLDVDAQRREDAGIEAEWQATRRRWPSDIDIAWQAANNCLVKLGCDENEALGHLLGLDPDNATAWWLAMDDAWKRGDTAAYDDALAHAAATRGSDARTGSVFLALQPLLAKAPVHEGCVPADAGADVAKAFGHPPTAADWASVEAWTYELADNAAVSYSSFAGCRERDAGKLSQRRRDDCVATLSVLAGGDTLIEQSVALPMLIQLSGDSAAGLPANGD